MTPDKSELLPDKQKHPILDKNSTAQPHPSNYVLAIIHKFLGKCPDIIPLW
jgi:hypothetical protein